MKNDLQTDSRQGGLFVMKCLLLRLHQSKANVRLGLCWIQYENEFHRIHDPWVRLVLSNHDALFEILHAHFHIERVCVQDDLLAQLFPIGSREVLEQYDVRSQGDLLIQLSETRLLGELEHASISHHKHKIHTHKKGHYWRNEWLHWNFSLFRDCLNLLFRRTLKQFRDMQLYSWHSLEL